MNQFEITGKINGFGIDFETGSPLLTIAVNEKNAAAGCYEQLKTADKLLIKISEYRKKRSLNANAYAWKLITEIADRIRADKNEVYFTMLKRYGQSELISVLAHIPIWDYVKYCEEAGESTLNGKKFKHYRVFKGSSEFDTREMSILIDGVVAEAKELGISTKTPDEIAKMKGLWRD